MKNSSRCKDAVTMLGHKLLLSRSFGVFIGVLVFVDLSVSILFSFPNTDAHSWVAHMTNYLSALFFTIEYLLRIVDARGDGAAGSQWKAKGRYLFSFFGVVDFISILPFTLPFFFDAGSQGVFHIARIFLVFKLTRYSESFRSVIWVFNTVKKELWATFIAIGIMLCFASLMMFYIEYEAQPEVFSDVGQGFWWAVITITSVGYGDIYPITGVGKVLGAVIALLGVLLFAIPTGIVSSAFMARKIRPVKESGRNEQGDYCPHCGNRLRDEMPEEVEER